MESTHGPPFFSFQNESKNRRNFCDSLRQPPKITSFPGTNNLSLGNRTQRTPIPTFSGENCDHTQLPENLRTPIASLNI